MSLLKLLTEEIVPDDDVRDIIHPDKREGIEGSTLGYEPVVPDEETHRAAGREYARAVKAFQDATGIVIRDPGSPAPILMGMMELIDEIRDIEADNREFLENLAIETVLDLPEFEPAREAYDAGDITIIAKLTEGLTLEVDMDKEDEIDRVEFDLQKELADVDQEMIKRRFVNTLIQGHAMSKMDLYKILATELNDIDPQLLNKYAVLMTSGGISHWLMPDRAPMNAAGAESVEQNEDGTATIKVEAIVFPLLIHELVKGLTEYVGMAGYPESPSLTADVMSQIDTPRNEVYDLMIGRHFWDKFADAIGPEHKNRTFHVLEKLLQLPAVDPDIPDSFAAVVKHMIEDPEEAKKIVNGFLDDIEEAIAEYELEPYEDSPAYDDGDVDLSDVDLDGIPDGIGADGAVYTDEEDEDYDGPTGIDDDGNLIW